MTGDVNLFFDSKLDAQYGNPTTKKENGQLNSSNLKKLINYVIYGE